MATQFEQVKQDFLIARLIETEAQLKESLDALNSTLATLKGNSLPKTLNREQVAELLHVTPGTVSNWVSTHKIPYRRAGRAIFFILDEVLQWSKPEPKR